MALAHNPQSVQSASSAFDITPADGADLAFVTRGLYVGVGGDVKVVMAGGETVTFKNLVAGVVHPLQVSKVFATLTTATQIIGVV
jgi:hypothetical protein